MSDVPEVSNEVSGTVNGIVVQTGFIGKLFINSSDDDEAGEHRLAGLATLLAAQQSAADTSPYQLKPGMVPLSQVYVDQLLKPVSYQDRLDAHALPREEIQRLRAGLDNDEVDAHLASLLVRGAEPEAVSRSEFHRITRTDPEDLVEEHRNLLAELAEYPTAARLLATDQPKHLVITGAPGTGKSSLSLRLVAQIATEQTGPLTRIAIRVTAADLARQSGSWQVAVIRAAEAALGCHLDSPLPEDLHVLLSAVPWVVVVDGLDEIADQRVRARLLNDLTARMNEPVGRLRLIVLSRPLPELDLERFGKRTTSVYELCGFDSGRLHQFSRQWFGTARRGSRQFLDRVGESGIHDVVANPLFATIAALIFEASDGAELPPTTHELMERLISEVAIAKADDVEREQEAVLARFRRHPAPGLMTGLTALFDRQAELVACAARTTVQDGQAAVLPALDDWVRQHIGGLACEKVPDWRDFLATIVCGSGLLVRYEDGVAFVHKSIADHLYAQDRAASLPTRFEPWTAVLDDVIAAARNGDDHEISVLVHYGRRCHNPADVLDRVHDDRRANVALIATLLVRGFPRDERALTRCRRWLREVSASLDTYVTDDDWRILAQLHDRQVDELIVGVVGGAHELDADNALRALLHHRRHLGASLLFARRNLAFAPLVRWKALAALVRMADEDQAEAVLEFLRTEAFDPSTPVLAAYSLIKLCASGMPGHRPQIEETLQEVLLRREMSSARRLIGAKMLAGFEFDHSRRVGEKILRCTAADAMEPPPIRVHAVAALTEFGPDHSDFVVRICREVMNNSTIEWKTWIEANRLVALVQPGSLERRRKALLSLLRNDESLVRDQVWAAAQLILLDDSEDRLETLAFLRSVEDRKGATAAEKRAARKLISEAALGFRRDLG